MCYKPADKAVRSTPAASVSLSLAATVTGLDAAAASATFSRDAATSSDAKARGNDTVMEETQGRFLVDVGRGSDVGTTRRSAGDDTAAGTARRNTGDDKGPAEFSRRQCRTDRIWRGDMRRMVDDD